MPLIRERRRRRWPTSCWLPTAMPVGRPNSCRSRRWGRSPKACPAEACPASAGYLACPATKTATTTSTATTSRARSPARTSLAAPGPAGRDVYEGVVQDLIEELGQLPGVGPKGAQRIAFYLLTADPQDVRKLAATLIEVT